MSTSTKPIKGMLTLDQLRTLVAEEKIETVIIGFTDHYGRMCGKRMDAEFFLDSPATAVCNYLLAVDMEMNPVRGYDFASWEKGYGDVGLKPDFSTLRIASWLPKTAIVLANVVNEKSHQLVSVAPRSILISQIEKLSKELNAMAMAASELEVYTFSQSYREAAKNDYKGLEPVSYYNEDYQMLQMTRDEPLIGAVRRHLRDSGIPVENSKGEAGDGQHEVNIRYTEALAMADRHTVYKQLFKEVADQLGLSVTFMAKPVQGQSGSSCHIHMSLWTNDGKSLFSPAEGEPVIELGGGVKCTENFKYFLGGWIKHTQDMMLFYAPTVNSYKRFVDESWAPTRLAWSRDNRTAGFRVVGEGKAQRIECRIPGADANVYLAFAASIASGLDGIKNKIEPPPIFEGNIYASQKLERVPKSLRDAIEIFEKSTFAKEAFGEEVYKHYLHHAKSEQAAYELAVTDWERRRYFERI